MSASQVMEKASSCFICGQQFEFSELNEHERICLENIKANDIQYTRQNTEEQASSISSRPESLSLSNHSASSNESYEKRYLRCYICGTDVPTYLRGIHEKTCKKNWESGLLNVDRKTNVRAEMFRSLSRSSSRSDVNVDHPKPGGLRKAKSSTLYRRASHNNALSTSNDDLRRTKNSKSATNLNSKSATNLSESQNSLVDEASDFPMNKLNTSSSHTELTKQVDLYLDLDFPDDSSSIRNARSVTNLKVDIPSHISKVNLKSKTKSLQDLRKKETGVSPPSSIRSGASPTPPISPTSPCHKQKSSSNNPQYVVCHLCGKLYSQHSIVIHIKQCEKTRALQRTVGTNVDYKIKSRSLADLSKGKVHASRVNSISNLVTSASRSSKPPSGRSNDRRRPNSSISSSMDNLSFNHRKETHSADSKKKENFNSKKDKADLHDFNVQNALSTTPGLQKCYLCGQLYGTRSLPIHQKQCYIKQERLREQEVQTKKKKKKDIKVLPFGRATYSENSTPSPTGNHFESPPTPMRPHSNSSPNRLFSSENGTMRAENQVHKTRNGKKECNGDHEGSLSSSLSSETDDISSPRSPSSPISVKDLMMTCVHCGCQCEPYTMAIHEKVCRKSTPEIRIENASDHLNGVNGSNMAEKITNGGLIHCEGCDGDFCASEIFQHRINCRTSIL